VAGGASPPHFLIKQVAGLAERATLLSARGRRVSFWPNLKSECRRARAEKSASSALSSPKLFREISATLIALLTRSVRLCVEPHAPPGALCDLTYKYYSSGLALSSSQNRFYHSRSFLTDSLVRCDSLAPPETAEGCRRGGACAGLAQSSRVRRAAPLRPALCASDTVGFVYVLTGRLSVEDHLDKWRICLILFCERGFWPNIIQLRV